MIDAGMLARIDELLDTVYNLKVPKGVKEEALREIRKIERATGKNFYGRIIKLDTERQPCYNAIMRSR